MVDLHRALVDHCNGGDVCCHIQLWQLFLARGGGWFVPGMLDNINLGHTGVGWGETGVVHHWTRGRGMDDASMPGILIGTEGLHVGS